jgi:magnesium transporter
MDEHAHREELKDYVERRDFVGLRELFRKWEVPEVAEAIDHFEPDERAVLFRILPRSLAAETFEHLSPENQRELVTSLAKEQVARLLDDMAPDDRTALLEELPASVTRELLRALSPEQRAVAVRLLGYPEQSIGRLMTPEWVAVRLDWTVERVLQHIREHGQDRETLNVIYVVDDHNHLIDDLHIREILLSSPETRVGDLLDRRFVALKAADDQETSVEVFRQYDRVALPVTDSDGVLIGIVTVDDVLDVAEEEATEDIHKIGGSEALDEPYLATPFWQLIGKRARWLIVLFLGEMLTATAMARYETDLARAMVLAIFIPLIISSGGNSGSQAATFIIRALALKEVGLRHWRRVLWRELRSGLALGSILGLIGALRVIAGAWIFGSYGDHWLALAGTIGIALLGVVIWGTLSGAMLPLFMQRVGIDPAASSAPFVATLVDVTGIIIYFSAAELFLRGRVL